jgi:hypothetical protein
MKSIMLAVCCVAMIVTVSGCRYETSTRFKHMPGVSDPEGQLKDHISYATRERTKLFHDEWRNVKCNVTKPDSLSQPFAGTITAEVYEFDNATATSPSGRTDYEISLVYRNGKWALKELKADSGPIGRDAWQSQGTKSPVPENSIRWRIVRRELELP